MWYKVEISECSSRRRRKLRENRTKNEKVISEWTLRWRSLCWANLSNWAFLRFSRAHFSKFKSSAGMPVFVMEKQCDTQLKSANGVLEEEENCAKIGLKTAKLLARSTVCAEPRRLRPRRLKPRRLKARRPKARRLKPRLLRLSTPVFVTESQAIYRCNQR
jgi:hypothetical protein